jgi:hypothetical protein
LSNRREHIDVPKHRKIEMTILMLGLILVMLALILLAIQPKFFFVLFCALAIVGAVIWNERNTVSTVSTAQAACSYTYADKVAYNACLVRHQQ